MAQSIDPDRLGVCSWSLQPDSPADLAKIVGDLGLRRVQLALQPLVDDPPIWGDAGDVLRDAGLTLVSGMFATVGEDYSSLESIRRTGGLVPDETWDDNWANILKIVPVADELGLKRVSFHAGFIPEDRADPRYDALLIRIRKVADVFHGKGIELLFETGQETADDLLRFLDDLEQPGVGVNFDPANMILYDKGDPVEALRKLMPHVKQVHIKDAKRTTTPGEWGTEVVVGTGEVDWPGFVAALREGNYGGDLLIEREAGDQRMADVRAAAEHIRSLIGG